MAVRMQQRRATALQWLEADPILEPGEIGFETDTVAFKIGDGINTCSRLDYFETTAALQGTIDDYVPLTEKGDPLGVATLDAAGFVPASQLNIDLSPYYTSTEVDTEISTAVTGLASETFVNTAISTLVDSAPGALDTLNELAAALGDDANFATTVTNSIADKANSENPEFIINSSQLLDSSYPFYYFAKGNFTSFGVDSTVTFREVEPPYGGGTTEAMKALQINDVVIFDGTENNPLDEIQWTVTSPPTVGTDGPATYYEWSVELTNSSDFSFVAQNINSLVDYQSQEFPAVYKIESSTISSELSYLDGATSAIQTQLDAKAPLTPAVNAKTANYTLTANDKGNFVTCDGTFTITIPSGVFSAGDRIDFVNIGTGVITFTGSGVTVNSVDSAVTIDTQWAGATFFFTSPTSGVLIGKLA